MYIVPPLLLFFWWNRAPIWVQWLLVPDVRSAVIVIQAAIQMVLVQKQAPIMNQLLCAEFGDDE